MKAVENNQAVELRKKKAEEDIQDAINKSASDDLDKKWSEFTYDGKSLPELPEWFLSDAKKSVLSIPPYLTQITGFGMNRICQMELQDVSFGDMHYILRIYQHAEPSSFCENIDDYIQKLIVLDSIRKADVEANEYVNQNAEKLKQILISEYDTKTWEKKSTSKFHN
jgi:hypothetical protein